MDWDVEYTDEFEKWWSGLTESETESVRASILLLRGYGHNLRFPHSSGSCGFSTADGRSGCCMRSIRGVARSCCSAVTRPETTAGTRSMCPSPTDCMTNM
nr:hypothetical protein [Rhodanobacter glycinis]